MQEMQESHHAEEIAQGIQPRVHSRRNLGEQGFCGLLGAVHVS